VLSAECAGPLGTPAPPFVGANLPFVATCLFARACAIKLLGMSSNVTTKSLARRAGWLYAAQCLPAPFAYLYLPAVLLSANAVVTAERVRASTGLLRAGVLAELLSATLTVFTLVAFYRLFRRVDEKVSAILAAMMLVSVPISFVNAIFNIAPLVLVNNSAIASQLGAGQIAALVTLFLRLHGYGVLLNQIFWGLWLFPYGILVRRSGFIPPVLAYPLFAAGAGYLVNTLGMLLLPPGLRWIAQSAMILGIGELPALVWLQFWGARSTGASTPTLQEGIAVGAG
jgi:hypothetical protein